MEAEHDCENGMKVNMTMEWNETVKWNEFAYYELQRWNMNVVLCY